MFSAIYNYGVQRDLIENNPVRATEPVPVDNGVIRYLLPSEEEESGRRCRRMWTAVAPATSS